MREWLTERTVPRWAGLGLSFVVILFAIENAAEHGWHVWPTVRFAG